LATVSIVTKTPSTHTYALSLHDALPISSRADSFASSVPTGQNTGPRVRLFLHRVIGPKGQLGWQQRFLATRDSVGCCRKKKIARSEEHTAELQSRGELVYRRQRKKGRKQ